MEDPDSGDRTRGLSEFACFGIAVRVLTWDGGRWVCELRVSARVWGLSCVLVTTEQNDGCFPYSVDIERLDTPVSEYIEPELDMND